MKMCMLEDNFYLTGFAGLDALALNRNVCLITLLLL